MELSPIKNYIELLEDVKDYGYYTCLARDAKGYVFKLYFNVLVKSTKEITTVGISSQCIKIGINGNESELDAKRESYSSLVSKLQNVFRTKKVCYGPTGRPVKVLAFYRLSKEERNKFI